MSIFNNVVNSQLVQTGLCVIVEGSKITAPATIVGNFLEAATHNKIAKTVGKTLQSAGLACLNIWAALNVLDAVAGDNFKQMVGGYTVKGVGVLTLGIPLVCEAVRYFSPEHIETIDSFKKSFATTIKVVNILSSVIALGWFCYTAITLWEISSVAMPLLLNVISLTSSVSALQREARSHQRSYSQQFNLLAE